jgi:hypothetical protein
MSGDTGLLADYIVPVGVLTHAPDTPSDPRETPMAEVQKICVKCGADVANAERTKDKQGNYWCRPCYEKALAARKAQKPRPTPPPVPNLTEQLISEASDYQENVCPACRNPMPGGAVICTRCGLNTSTNRQSKTRVEKTPKEKGAKGPSIKAPDISGLTSSPLLYFVLGAAGGMVPLVAFASPTLLGPGILLWFVLALGISVWVVIQGFLTSIVSGVLLIVTCFIPVANIIYPIYFIFWRNENAILKLVYGGFLVGSVILGGAAGAGVLPGMDELMAN